MIESSPKVVTQMLRMTPATSRGVPVFLPGSHALRETPASATFPNNKVRFLPQTPQARRAQRATILETPLSPGHGELAAEAVLLENTLNQGELPSEDSQLEG